MFSRSESALHLLSGGSFHIDAGEGLLLPAHLAVDCNCDGSFAIMAMTATADVAGTWNAADAVNAVAAARSWLEPSH